MEERTKKTLIVGSSILLITTGLYFVSKVIVGKIKANRAQDPADILLNEQGSGTNPLSSSEEEEAKKYNPANDAKYIYDKLDGINIFYYGDEINGKIAGLTDAKVKKLAQYYKTKYKITLYKQLDDEWDDLIAGNYYEGAMNRLKNLGLT